MIEQFFGSNPRTKLLDVFISHPYIEYSLEDLNELWYNQFKATDDLTEFTNELYEQGIIKKGSKKWFYTVKKSSDSYKLLNMLDNCLAGLSLPGEEWVK